MGRRGRPASVEAQKIIEGILPRSKEIIISKSGSIIEKTNDIWKTISAELKNVISPLSLYSYVTDNRFEIKSKLYELEGILPDMSQNSIDTTAEDSVNLSHSRDSNSHENIKRSYKIFLSKEVFQALIVVKTRKRPTGRNKKIETYKAFKPGVWEDVINDLLVDSTKITCGLSFVTHFITADESSGTFKAHCACGSKVDGVITNDDTNVNVIAPVIYPSNMSQDEIDFSSLKNLSMKTPCNTKECKGLTETNIFSLGNAIIFEVFDKGTNEKIKLNSLPRSFKNPEDMREIYKLVGAVHFMPPAVNLRSSSDVRLGHFTAVCLRGTLWTEYDDRCEKAIIRKNTHSINPRMVLYAKIT